jgi:hypothetical protein
MKKIKASTFSFLLGIVLSLFFIYIISKNVDFSKVFSIYRNFNLFWILPFFILLMIQTFLRAFKWNIMLKPIVKLKAYNSFKFEMIGLGINNILPFRIGELLRSFLVAKTYGVSKISVFSTIVVERIIDFLAMFLLFSLFSWYVKDFSLLISPIFFKYLTFFSLVIILLLVLSDKIINCGLFLKLRSLHPKLEEVFIKFARAIEAFKSPIYVLIAITIAVFQWLVEALNNYLFAIAFGVNSLINFPKSVMILCSTAVGVSLPSMPGYFGNFEFAFSKICEFFGVESSKAFAYAFATHFTNYIITTLMGLFFIYMSGFSFKEVFNLKRNEAEDRK